MTADQPPKGTSAAHTVHQYPGKTRDVLVVGKSVALCGHVLDTDPERERLETDQQCEMCEANRPVYYLNATWKVSNMSVFGVNW